MPRLRIKYDRQRDPAEEARKQAVGQFQQQRQAQASAYAAARFNEWAASAQDREALINARLQNQESEAELKGAQFRYNFWKDNELRRQTTAYYTAMPALQEQLKQNGIYPGSARYAAEISAFAAELPDAVTHNEAIRNDLKNYAKVDATSAEIANKISTVQQAFADLGQHPTSFTTTAQGGVDVKSTRPNEDVQKDLFTGHKLTRTQFENFDPSTAKIGTLDDKGTLQLNEQGTGGDIQFKVIKDGKANNISMPIPEFNRYKVAFGQEPIKTSTPQGSPAPSPTPSPSPTPGGIEVGAQRTINGQVAEWDGQGWSAVQQ